MNGFLIALAQLPAARPPPPPPGAAAGVDAPNTPNNRNKM